MPFSSFVAARYLKPKRTFVSIITIISIVGVSLGVWLLAVVIPVFTGFGEEVKSSILGFQPHLQLAEKEGVVTTNWREAWEVIDGVGGISSATPFVTGPVLAEATTAQGSYLLAPKIRGILQPEGAELKRLSDMIVDQKVRDFLDLPEPPAESSETDQKDFNLRPLDSAIVGQGIADSHGIEIGNILRIYSATNLSSVLDQFNQIETADSEEERDKILEELRKTVRPTEVTVTGIFSSDNWEYDSEYIYLNLETAQELYGLREEDVHGISMRIDDLFLADSLREQLITQLPDRFSIETWREMNSVIFDAITSERRAMYIILFMIVIVSSFCIMNTMITVTVQKRSEIGLMKALGAREAQIAWVFISQGIIVGLIGVIVGLLVAQLTIINIDAIAQSLGNTFGVDLFSSDMGYDHHLPVIQEPIDLIIISVGAFLTCAFASAVPAAIAANLDPAHALRTE